MKRIAIIALAGLLLAGCAVKEVEEPEDTTEEISTEMSDSSSEETISTEAYIQELPEIQDNEFGYPKFIEYSGDTEDSCIRTYFYYTDAGKIEKIIQTKDDMLTGYSQMEYDDKNRLLSVKSGASEREMVYKSRYKYDDTIGLKEVFLYSYKNKLSEYQEIYQDEAGNTTHEVIYDGDGNVETDVYYSYDEDGAVEEKQVYERDHFVQCTKTLGNDTVYSYELMLGELYNYYLNEARLCNYEDGRLEYSFSIDYKSYYSYYFGDGVRESIPEEENTGGSTFIRGKVYEYPEGCDYAIARGIAIDTTKRIIEYNDGQIIIDYDALRELLSAESDIVQTDCVYKVKINDDNTVDWEQEYSIMAQEEATETDKLEDDVIWTIDGYIYYRDRLIKYEYDEKGKRIKTHTDYYTLNIDEDGQYYQYVYIMMYDDEYYEDNKKIEQYMMEYYNDKGDLVDATGSCINSVYDDKGNPVSIERTDKGMNPSGDTSVSTDYNYWYYDYIYDIDGDILLKFSQYIYDSITYFSVDVDETLLSGLGGRLTFSQVVDTSVISYDEKNRVKEAIGDYGHYKILY